MFLIVTLFGALGLFAFALGLMAGISYEREIARNNLGVAIQADRAARPSLDAMLRERFGLDAEAIGKRLVDGARAENREAESARLWRESIDAEDETRRLARERAPEDIRAAARDRLTNAVNALHAHHGTTPRLPPPPPISRVIRKPGAKEAASC